MQDVALFGINNFWIINNDFIMRNMTVEYLRVIFIFLIVLLHILWKDYGGLHIMSYNQSIESYIQLGLTNLTSLGVTGFVLISGYYGVKLKVGRIASLWFQTTTYALVSVVLLGLSGGEDIIKGVVDAPLSLFDGGWWFVTDYLILMLLSPFLNAGLDIMNKRQLLLIIVFFSFIMYGAEWYHAKNASMPLLLFFNTYLIGRYMRLYPIIFLNKYKYYIFLIGLFGLIAEPMMLHALGLDGKMKFVGGNFNILVLVANIALLLICINQNKQGKGNVLTKNVLAVYLIHESGVGRIILHGFISCKGNDFNFLFIIAVVAVVIIISVLIEEIRKRLFFKVENKVISFVESRFKI